MAALVLRFLSAAALLLGSCSPQQRPDYYSSELDAGRADGGLYLPGPGDSGPAGPPDPDASGYCGNLVLPVLLERPNLYFVMDRSGSMRDPAGIYDKYTVARLAMADVLRRIGHRISYGAAVFPAFVNDANGCAAGNQVFATTMGDPPQADRSKNGPTLTVLMNLLAGYVPNGNTPTAATLTAITPILRSLPGRSAVILATDGGPNCNAALRCSSERCIPNIEGMLVGGVLCAGTFNCCDPQRYLEAPLNCVDDEASYAAVQELAAAGIPTYVVGLPGAGIYADVLNRFAELGQTARATEPRYYPADNQVELTDALRQIMGSVAIRCDAELDRAPPSRGRVNVYLDDRLVSYDELNGWAWTGEQRLELRGAACEQLKSGEVVQLQVVSGCRTAGIE